MDTIGIALILFVSTFPIAMIGAIVIGIIDALKGRNENE